MLTSIPSTMPRSAKSGTIVSELALIEKIRRQAAAAAPYSRSLRLGIGDDCAILGPSAGHEICVTTDFSLEGVHFRRDWHPAESAGHRCLARGLSDLAAMGAEPLAVFLSLAVPAGVPSAWIDGFFEGLLALARRHRAPLAGGDIARSPALPGQLGLIAADIVAVGQLPRGEARLRSAARPGDLLYVTGALGGSAAELLALARRQRGFGSGRQGVTEHPHLYPQPRIAVGRRLRTLAHAMIDISDGLSTDLTHICEESKVSAVLDEATLPIHSLALRSRKSGHAPLSLALHGGEDYELLFTAAPGTRIPRTIAGVPIHRIGILRRPAPGRPRILLGTRQGAPTPVLPRGWEHFREPGISPE